MSTAAASSSSIPNNGSATTLTSQRYGENYDNMRSSSSTIPRREHWAAEMSAHTLNLLETTARAKTAAKAIRRQLTMADQGDAARYAFQMFKMPIRDSKRSIDSSVVVQSNMRLNYNEISSAQTKSIVCLSRELFCEAAEQIGILEKTYASLEPMLCEQIKLERFVIFCRDIDVRALFEPLAVTRAASSSSTTSSPRSSSGDMSVEVAEQTYDCMCCLQAKSADEATEFPCCIGQNVQPLCYDCLERALFEKSRYGTVRFVKCFNNCRTNIDVYESIEAKLKKRKR